MPRGRKKISREDREILREREKKYIEEHNVFLTCKKCGKGKHITVNKPEIYTEEVREKYVCLNCQGRKRW